MPLVLCALVLVVSKACGCDGLDKGAVCTGLDRALNHWRECKSPSCRKSCRSCWTCRTTSLSHAFTTNNVKRTTTKLKKITWNMQHVTWNSALICLSNNGRLPWTKLGADSELAELKLHRKDKNMHTSVRSRFWNCFSKIIVLCGHNRLASDSIRCFVNFFNYFYYP